MAENNLSPEELAEALRRLTESSNAAADAEFASNVARNEAKKALVELSKSFVSAAMKGGGEFDKYSKSIETFGSTVGTITSAMGPLGKTIGLTVEGFTKLVSKIGEQTDNLLKASDQISKLGSANAFSTEAIFNMANKAGLTSKELDKMIKPMQSLSGSMSLISNTASDGVKRFTDMIAVSKEVRMEFQRLGMNDEERIQAQTDYISIMAKTGNMMTVRGKTDKELQEASLEYTKNLLELSAMTGKNAEQVKQEQEIARANVAWQMQQSKWNTDIKRLEKEGKTEEANRIKKERDLSEKMLVDIQMVGGKSASAAAAMQYLTGAVTKQSAQFKVLGFDIESEIKSVKDGTYQQGQAADRLSEATEKSYQTFGHATMAVSDSLQKATGMDLERMTRQNNIAGRSMVDAAKDAGDKIRQNAEGKGAVAEDKAQGGRNLLTESERSLKTFVDEWIKKSNPLVSGFGLATAGSIALSTAALAAAAALGKIGLGTIIRRGGIAGGAGGIAGGGGNLLTGIANGLKAFANPQVVLGAAGFGAAITAIGAGIAGATWIMGKALPSLAEGLQPFEKLDGDRLIQTGKGVAALGGGLAVFGVGGVAASFGAVVSSVVDGLSSFFGGKTPFQKVEEFSNLDINASTVKENADAFVAFGNAMAQYKGGAEPSLFGTLNEGLVSFFGGTKNSAFVRLVDFSNLDIKDPVKVKKNADAFVAFGNAMAQYKGGNQFRNIADNLVTGLNKFFGGESIVEKFVKFAKLDVDPDKASKLAEAFAKYGQTMSVMGSAPAPTPTTTSTRSVASTPTTTSTPTPTTTSTLVPKSFAQPSASSQKPSDRGEFDLTRYLQSTALIESGGNRMAKAGTSSASGLFQFTSGTWNQMTKEMGKNYSLNDRFDPQKSAEVMSFFTKKQKTQLEQSIKTSASDVDMYMAHFLGAGGASNFINAMKKNPNGIAANLDPAAAKANRSIYYDKTGNPRTLADVYNLMSDKMTTASRAVEMGKWGKGAISSDVLSLGPTNSVQLASAGARPAARFGGMFDGPESGYPVTLHGREIVLPNANFDFSTDQKPVSKQELPMPISSSNMNNSTNTDFDADLIVTALSDVVGSKLDEIVDRIERSTRIQEDLLRYSRA